jgi:hypothetical protein
MNERIKELSARTSKELIGMSPHRERWQEKFAELIVLECKSAMYKEFAEGKFMTLEGCYHAINEHFGVKE